MVTTAAGGMCGVRSRCGVEVRAGQRPQELGSLRKRWLKGPPASYPSQTVGHTEGRLLWPH